MISLVIDRVHEDIDQVLAGREPVTEDRSNLPYTDAVIHEIQRLGKLDKLLLSSTLFFSSILPTNHKTS